MAEPETTGAGTLTEPIDPTTVKVGGWKMTLANQRKVVRWIAEHLDCKEEAITWWPSTWARTLWRQAVSDHRWFWKEFVGPLMKAQESQAVRDEAARQEKEKADHQEDVIKKATQKDIDELEAVCLKYSEATKAMQAEQASQGHPTARG